MSSEILQKMVNILLQTCQSFFQTLRLMGRFVLVSRALGCRLCLGHGVLSVCLTRLHLRGLGCQSPAPSHTAGGPGWLIPETLPLTRQWFCFWLCFLQRTYNNPGRGSLFKLSSEAFLCASFRRKKNEGSGHLKRAFKVLRGTLSGDQGTQATL